MENQELKQAKNKMILWVIITAIALAICFYLISQEFNLYYFLLPVVSDIILAINAIKYSKLKAKYKEEDND